MDNAPSQKELRQLRFFGELPEELTAQLAAISRTVAFPSNATIFREGCENQDLFFICSGCVSLEMNVPRRGRVPILTVGPGDVLAWSAALAGGRFMTATAIAVEPTRAVAIAGEALLAMCESNHELGYRFQRQLAAALSQRLVATRLQLLDLFAETTPH